MEKVNDYELLYLIRRGNNEALELLFNKYRRYAMFRLKNYSIDFDDRQEIIQEFLTELNRSIYKFKEEYNVLLVTYLEKIISRIINKYFIKLYRNKKVVDYYLEVNQKSIQEKTFRYNQYDEIIVDKKESGFFDSLSSIEKEVYLEIMVKNVSKIIFSEKHNISVKSIYNHIQHIRSKYRKYTNSI